MRTLQEISTAIGNYLGRPDEAYRSRIETAVNIAIEDYYREFGSPYLQSRLLFVSTGENPEGLPQIVERPIAIMDKAHEREVRYLVHPERFHPSGLSGGSSPPPQYWRIEGAGATQRNPEGEDLVVSSSDPADTRVVSFLGYVSSGRDLVPVRTSVALSGVSSVPVPAAFAFIDGISVSSRSPAVVTVKNSSGVIYAVLGSQALDCRYTWIRWLPSPQALSEFLIEYVPRAPTLVAPEDPVPTPVSTEYVFWNAMAQLAADMERRDILLLATGKIDRVLRTETKRLAMGGANDLYVRPLPEVWD